MAVAVTLLDPEKMTNEPKTAMMVVGLGVARPKK
jgi:hypothetical protein